MQEISAQALVMVGMHIPTFNLTTEADECRFLRLGSVRFLSIIRCTFGIHLDRSCCHTRGKSRAHEIVRAQKKCPKAVPNHFQNHVASVVTGSQVYSEVIMCDWALNKMLFQ